MKALTANELRQLFLDFFVSKGHAVIPSASIIPENDPTVLFTTAGMHPLVPYLMGQPHPAGTRLEGKRTGGVETVDKEKKLSYTEQPGRGIFLFPDRRKQAERLAPGVGTPYADPEQAA